MNCKDTKKDTNTSRKKRCAFFLKKKKDKIRAGGVQACDVHELFKLHYILI